VDVDGTLEADAITIGGTAIGSIYGAIAGSSSIVTTGALDSGSITSGFGTIDTGSSAITTTGVITGGTVEATTDTAASDNAAMGYTSAEGLILTGQGSTNDVTIKNDADETVISIPTGGTRVNLGAASTVSSSADGLVVNDGANAGMTIYSTGTSSGQMKLSLTNAEGADAGAAIIYNNANDDLVFNVNGATERVRFLGTGGITFGGDTADANALDDYEEGTWTATITFGGAATSVSYGSQTCYYTKIGNVVTVSGLFALSNKGSSSGDAKIGGLPYTANSNTGAYAGTAAYVKNISFADVPAMIVAVNSTVILLEEVTNAGDATTLTNSNFDNNAEMFINLTYRVA
jgi:hypothetical protein